MGEERSSRKGLSQQISSELRAGHMHQADELVMDQPANVVVPDMDVAGPARNFGGLSELDC